MANLNGTQVHPISAPGWDGYGAQWSPDGYSLVNQQRHGSTDTLGNLFVYKTIGDHRRPSDAAHAPRSDAELGMVVHVPELRGGWSLGPLPAPATGIVVGLIIALVVAVVALGAFLATDRKTGTGGPLRVSPLPSPSKSLEVQQPEEVSKTFQVREPG